ncbi:response regulator [uncultured Sulfitobacter sp.]|uniref:response regulator n=1 Tax=uncultured Sulfitobacter sp. TaxID=191468 RepID=UPI0026016744|nr:response regulator [uncultured Sulfitobacter sp.]
MTSDPKRIFIVDDEALIAFEMADALEDLGFEVVGPSTHLKDALGLAKEGDFDVACLDVNLGQGKTSEPIARILTERGIPYVYITAYEASQIDFLKSNDNVVRKPVSIRDLKQALLDAQKS